MYNLFLHIQSSVIHYLSVQRFNTLMKHERQLKHYGSDNILALYQRFMRSPEVSTYFFRCISSVQYWHNGSSELVQCKDLRFLVIISSRTRVYLKYPLLYKMPGLYRSSEVITAITTGLWSLGGCLIRRGAVDADLVGARNASNVLPLPASFNIHFQPFVTCSRQKLRSKNVPYWSCGFWCWGYKHWGSCQSQAFIGKGYVLVMWLCKL